MPDLLVTNKQHGGSGGGIDSLSAELAAILTIIGSTLDIDSQTANRVLASPDGSAGKPTMRACFNILCGSMRVEAHHQAAVGQHCI